MNHQLLQMKQIQPLLQALNKKSLKKKKKKKKKSQLRKETEK